MYQITKTTLINAQKFGQLLDISKRQIFRLKATGKIPAPLKVGGSVRWNECEVYEWIAAGCPDRKTWEARKAGQ